MSTLVHTGAQVCTAKPDDVDSERKKSDLFTIAYVVIFGFQHFPGGILT